MSEPKLVHAWRYKLSEDPYELIDKNQLFILYRCPTSTDKSGEVCVSLISENIDSYKNIKNLEYVGMVYELQIIRFYLTRSEIREYIYKYDLI